MTDTSQYLCLKVGQAAKTGERSTGHITYRVLASADRQHLFFTLTGNEGGGWFSHEIVPVSRIEEILDSVPDKNQPLPAKTLRPAFVSKSVNNAGFLMALLRAESLFTPAPGDMQLHVLVDDWLPWKRRILEEDGVPYVPTPKAGATVPVVDPVPSKKERKAERSGKRKDSKKVTSTPHVDEESITGDDDLTDVEAEQD